MLRKFAFTGVLGALAAAALPAQAIDVAEIIHKANYTSYYQDVSGKAKVAMEITDSQGRSRSREFVILRKDADPAEEFTGNQKFYVYFQKPADVNKTTFLVWKQVNGDDDRWLYLPALDLVKRIAASDKRTSFVGSNFFYEDVSGRNPAEDSHELVEETDQFYVVKSTPKKPAEVEFDYYLNTIHKNTFLPVKTEYYKNDKVYRVYEATNVAAVEGRPTVIGSKMSDLETGSTTAMTYTEVDYGVEIEDDIFTERYLRTPPRKLLR